MVYILQPGYRDPYNIKEKDEVHIFRIRSFMGVLQEQELYRKEGDIDHQHIKDCQS
jgi:hypothetical protein